MTLILLGDRWSLGFLAETEKQVVRHLEKQLELLPSKDQKSRKILQQMQADEAHHGETAKQLGAADLPFWIQFLMKCHSKIMTTVAYWI